VTLAVVSYQSFSSTPFNDTLFLILTGLTAVVYWYGLGRLGLRIKNGALHWAALISLASSFVYDMSTAAGTYFPAAYINSGVDTTVAYGMALLSALGLLLAGYALLTERTRFGTAGVIYGILSVLLGLMVFLGIGYAAYNPVLSVLLYFLGSYLLLHSRVRA
jgi:hypothetical protein